MKLLFSRNRVLASISGAVPFENPLSSLIPNRAFPKKKISSDRLKTLCEELDPLTNKHSSISSFFQDSSIVIGSKKYAENELKRGVRGNKKNVVGLLLSFPFKCRVPIKTGYHSLPDLGECMFIHRLGKICTEISTKTDFKFKIIVAEETDALAPVFGASRHDCKATRLRLNKYRDLLGYKSSVKFSSLMALMSHSRSQYEKGLFAQAERIKANSTKHKKQLKRVLSTIAISLPTNNLSLKESHQLVASFFNNSSTALEKKQLYDTSFKYLAFNELLTEKIYVSKTSRYLRLSVCPKKGRIGIRPTISKVKILPHHGVPVVRIKNNQRKFQIEYYFDFLLNTLNESPIEVCDEDGNFLYYEVEH